MQSNAKRFCSNCGNKLNPESDVCLVCGKIFGEAIFPAQKEKKDDSTIGTLAIIFGALGFTPLPIIGSIVGIILGIIGMTNKEYKYRGRSILGFWLAIGSLILWIIIICLSLYYIYYFIDNFNGIFPYEDPSFIT